MDALEYSHVAIKILKKYTAGSHLFRPLITHRIRHIGSSMRRRDRDEPAHTFDPAKPLHIIAGDDPSHAEAHQVERLPIW